MSWRYVIYLGVLLSPSRCADPGPKRGQHAAHRAVIGISVSPVINQGALPMLQGLRREDLVNLQSMASEYTWNLQEEPFWRDEPRQELGSAFEGQVSV